jgi:hypothetical protein
MAKHSLPLLLVCLRAVFTFPQLEIAVHNATEKVNELSLNFNYSITGFFRNPTIHNS